MAEICTAKGCGADAVHQGHWEGSEKRIVFCEAHLAPVVQLAVATDMVFHHEPIPTIEGAPEAPDGVRAATDDELQLWLTDLALGKRLKLRTREQYALVREAITSRLKLSEAEREIRARQIQLQASEQEAALRVGRGFNYPAGMPQPQLSAGVKALNIASTVAWPENWPDDAIVQCDWAQDCEKPAAKARYDAHLNLWLPVCEEHK